MLACKILDTETNAKKTLNIWRINRPQSIDSDDYVAPIYFMNNVLIWTEKIKIKYTF